MAKSKKIQFRDLAERENSERLRLERRLSDLTVKALKRGGTPDNLLLANLPPDEQKELQFLLRLKEEGLLDPLANNQSPERVEPLFVAVRDLFNEDTPLLGGASKFVSNFDYRGRLYVFNKDAAGQWNDATTFDDVVKISLVLGLIMTDEVTPPRITWDQRVFAAAAVKAPAGAGGKAPAGRQYIETRIIADKNDKAYPAFVEAFYRAIGESKKSESSKLADAVLSILDEEGDPTGNQIIPGKVECREFARVIRCLVDGGVKEPVPQLHRRINECLNKIQQVGEDQLDSGISLPDLNEVSNYQIQEENVRLMGPIICSAMFEELKVFQVLDKLVEQAQNGTLVTSRGKAGEMLYKYWKETPNRMSEGERSNLYALTLGTPGGDSSGMPNRDFNDLWLRFVSSVSSLVRQRTTDQLLRSSFPAAISQQQVRKAARDLALNLSSRGYGMTLYLALELQSQIKMIIQLLSDKEIMGIYGARDMWQVIDQVATLELAGGARNTARYRTLATCGAIITAWLANNVKKYNSSTSRMIIDTDEVLSIDPPTSSDATRTPTDYDLVNACELWLADTATSDDQIEQISQNPRESPMMTSRPVQIPAIAREMLDQAGVGVPGFGMGMRRQ
jgi:hypothetical protein